jgi:hypothetical protein
VKGKLTGYGGVDPPGINKKRDLAKRNGKGLTVGHLVL